MPMPTRISRASTSSTNFHCVAKQNRAKRRVQRLLRQSSHGEISDEVVDELKVLARQRSSQNPVDEQALIDEALGAELAPPEPDPNHPPSPQLRQKRRRSTGDSGNSSCCQSGDEGAASPAGMVSEVTAVLFRAALADQEPEMELEPDDADNDAQNEYIAVAVNSAGPDADAVTQEGCLDIDGNEQCTIDSARAAQTQQAFMGLVARRDSKPPRDEVEPVCDSASFPGRPSVLSLDVTADSGALGDKAGLLGAASVG